MMSIVPILAMFNRIRRKKIAAEAPAPSRRHLYEICKEFEKMNPHHCPVRLRAGDGVSVGPCWYYLKDGVCPVHGLVKEAK